LFRHIDLHGRFFRLRKTSRNDLSQVEITPFKARRNVIQRLRPSSF